MKLHLGCGRKRIEGFIGVDIQKSNNPDVVADIRDLRCFDDGSVDTIYACHVLEHVYRSDCLGVLRSWYKLLKPQGILRLAVPDFESVVKLYMQGVKLSVLIGNFYPKNVSPENTHYYTWDFDSLQEDLQTVGFNNVHRYNWRDTEHADLDDYSQAYYPHMDKENGVLRSLNVEATK